MEHLNEKITNHEENCKWKDFYHYAGHDDEDNDLIEIREEEVYCRESDGVETCISFNYYILTKLY